MRARSLAALAVVVATAVVGPGRPPSVGAQAAAFELGLAEVDITSPVGYRLDGNFSERLATGQRDPLKAKALVFRQGPTWAAIVATDLLGMPQSMSSEVRALAAARTGIPAANIAITATHTHTGPMFAGERARVFSAQAAAKFGKDPLAAVKYPETLTAKLVEVIVAAHAQVSPATMTFARTEEDRVSFNRRFHMKDGTVRFNPGVQNPEIVRVAGPIDPDLPFVLFSKQNKPVGSLTVFALHLDTTGGTEYSADYPGHLASELRREFGEGFLSVFGTGTCGDINHIDVTGERRYTAPLIGRQLGVSLLATRARQPLADPSLAVLSTRLALPLRRVTAEQAAAAQARLGDVGRSGVPFLTQVEIVTTLDLARRGSTLEADVQVIRLHPDVAVVLLPGEVFVELGLAIKRASPFRHTLVIELSNDNPAYIPTEKAFREGSYETVNSRIEPGGGEKLVDAAVELLTRLAVK
jgi:hypothetical protein